MCASIPPEQFYGPPSLRERRICAILESEAVSVIPRIPNCLTRLLGPSRTWKIFKKQQEAIDYALLRHCELMTFAFQHSFGERSFLTCHPIMLWFVNHHRPQDMRCTYEVIRENATCKLYLDIEFEREYNKSHDGIRILKTIKNIFRLELQKQFDISCTDNEILHLNSSSAEKFSHHMIFQLPKAAFENNYYVGNFVKFVCEKFTGPSQHRLLDECAKYAVSKENILELVISDRKGHKKLVIDTGVYTKNRHFRLLGNTKLHKNTPLVIDENNKFFPKGNEEYDLFLSSLITHFSEKIEKYLTFGQNRRLENNNVQVAESSFGHDESLSITSYTSIDHFVSQLILPHGRIRKRVESEQKLLYDVTGYRYCNNIGRDHRSNNVRFVVDLDRLVFYQMCYDSDCKGFLSTASPLPMELRFPRDDKLVSDVMDSILSDQDLLHFMDGGEIFLENPSWDQGEKESAHPMFELDDDVALLNVDENILKSNSHTVSEIFQEIDFQDRFSQENPGNIFCDMNVSDSDLLEIAECTDDLQLFSDFVT